MIIDMHTHTFPKNMAAESIAAMERDIYRSQGFEAKAVNTGTHEALCESTKDAGIDLSIVCPVATNIRQPEKINRLSVRYNKDTKDSRLFYFGAIHPDCTDYRDILDGIKEEGLLGVKLHPDYQRTYFDDEKYIRIIDYADKLGLVIVVHAGEDVGLPDTVHCTPDRILNVLKEVSPAKMVLAHMGGWRMWDEAEEKLIGLSVYLDTAVCLNHDFPVSLSNEQFVRMVRKHGADRVLFGTDNPWYEQKQAVLDIKSTNLTDDEKSKILGKNAANLLGIKGE